MKSTNAPLRWLSWRSQHLSSRGAEPGTRTRKSTTSSHPTCPPPTGKTPSAASRKPRLNTVSPPDSRARWTRSAGRTHRTAKRSRSQARRHSGLGRRPRRSCSRHRCGHQRRHSRSSPSTPTLQRAAGSTLSAPTTSRRDAWADGGGREDGRQGQRRLLHLAGPAQHRRAAEGLQGRLCRPARHQDRGRDRHQGRSARCLRQDSGTVAQTGAKKIDAFVCLDSASGKLVADAIKRTGDTTRVLVAWDVNPDTLQGIKDGSSTRPSCKSPTPWAMSGWALDALYPVPPGLLSKDYRPDPFAPFPVFVDTGTSLVDKSNVDGYLATAQAHAQ